MLGDVSATAGDGQVMLSWARVADATGYSYIVMDGDQVVRTATVVDQSQLSTISTTVIGLDNGTEYTFEVTASANAETHRASAVMTAMATPMAEVIAVVEGLPTFTAGSTSSFSNTNYKVQFQNGDAPINTLRDELVIEFHEDYTLPSSISNAAVTIVVDGACLLYTSPSPRDRTRSRMPSSA